MANIVTKHIPNTLTSCNLISGCIAIVFALSANYTMALTFIVVGAVFDFFDGMSARLLGVSSRNLIRLPMWLPSEWHHRR